MAKMIYATSDTFFGRSSYAKERGFNSVEEMDQAMIDKWNSKVNEGDIVWHLGNFGWDVISIENALMQLNGTINLILSEYDKASQEVFKLQNVKTFEGYYIMESKNLVLSHWPMTIWPAKYSSVKSMHLHGNDKELKANLDIEKRFNVNCELWSLGPISVDSLIEIAESAYSQ
jgi:calcineurin-like phosphoesterase family protein